MPEKDATLNIRCSAEQRDRIDKAAADLGMKRSEWVMMVLTERLDNGYRQLTSPAGTTLTMPRTRTGYRRPDICDHPLSLRSAKSADGSSRCFACHGVITPL